MCEQILEWPETFMRLITTAKVVKVCSPSAGCHRSLWKTESSPPTRMCGKQARLPFRCLIHKIGRLTWNPVLFSICVGPLALCCGRLPPWQNNPTKVCPMSRYFALSWKEACWRSHRTVLTCCKIPTLTWNTQLYLQLPVCLVFQDFASWISSVYCLLTHAVKQRCCCSGCGRGVSIPRDWLHSVTPLCDYVLLYFTVMCLFLHRPEFKSTQRVMNTADQADHQIQNIKCQMEVLKRINLQAQRSSADNKYLSDILS